MKYLIYFCVVLFAYNVISLPVDKKKSQDIPSNVNQKVEEEINNLGLEYERYLNEVVNTLEKDKTFKQKLENVSSEDIKSGKIAGHLDFVHHSVRTKLDELKRIEMDRLRKLIKQENELKDLGGNDDGRRWRTVKNQNSLDQFMLKYEHVDHSNPQKFSKDDLHKLIIKASADLEELDRKRREEFKHYEMEKEFQYQESLKNLTEEQKAETIKKHEEKINKHKQHARVHHPGSKRQLEEVWEQQDHMPKEEFNPKTFFALHDLNGDGYLDQEEVESLLSTEIKKLYDPNNPEDDPNEMMEEYHRMREHIYKEADKDGDGLISKKEFIDLTTDPDFNKDEGWKGIDEKPAYTLEELQQYEAQRKMALNHQYGYYVPQEYYQYQYDPNQIGLHPSQVGVHPGQVGVHPGQVGVHPGQVGVHPGQVGVHPGQLGIHPGQVGAYPGQVGAYPGQVGVHPGQVGVHPGQVGVHPGQVGVHPGQVGVHPGQVGVHPGQLGIHPGQVGVHPNQLGTQQNQAGVYSQTVDAKSQIASNPNKPSFGQQNQQYQNLPAHPPVAPQVGYQQKYQPQASNLNQPINSAGQASNFQSQQQNSQVQFQNYQQVPQSNQNPSQLKH